MRCNTAYLACLVAWVAIWVTSVSAHGGKLHKTTPDQEKYIRVKVATCSTWQPASGKLTPTEVLPTADRVAPVDVKGTVTLWQYLYDNCTYAGEDPSAGAAFNVTITRGGQPLSNTVLDGLAMAGSCKAGGVRPYYFDPSKKPLDDDENKLWFHNHTVKASAEGRLAGNGANNGIIRTVAEGKWDAAQAMMLVDTKTQTILSCCDLVPAGPANTNWTKALVGGKVCVQEDDDSHAAGKGNATDQHDHAGHNHAGHNHNHNDAGSSSKATSGSKAKSGVAAVVTAGWSVVGSAVLAMLLLLL